MFTKSDKQHNLTVNTSSLSIALNIAANITEIIPIEIIFKIVCLLDSKEVASVQIINKFFYDIGNIYWHNRYKEHFMRAYKHLNKKSTIHWCKQFYETRTIEYKELSSEAVAIFEMIKDRDIRALKKAIQEQGLMLIDKKGFTVLDSKDASKRTLRKWVNKKNLNDEIYQLIKPFYTNAVTKAIDAKKVDCHQRNLFYWAVLFKQPDKELKLLIHAGCAIDAYDHNHLTPLYVAMHGNIDTVKLLLFYGANVNDVNGKLQTPLHYAAAFATKEILELTLKSGTHPIDITGSDDSTPLFFAAEYGNFEACKYLIENGANINKRLQSGATPLYIAAQYNRVNIVKYLLEKGANIDAALHNGSTPLFVACCYGRSEIIKLLMDANAKTDLKAKNKVFLFSKTLSIFSNISQEKMLTPLEGAELNNKTGTVMQLELMNRKKSSVLLDLCNAGLYTAINNSNWDDAVEVLASITKPLDDDEIEHLQRIRQEIKLCFFQSLKQRVKGYEFLNTTSRNQLLMQIDSAKHARNALGQILATPKYKFNFMFTMNKDGETKITRSIKKLNDMQMRLSKST